MVHQVLDNAGLLFAFSESMMMKYFVNAIIVLVLIYAVSIY
jgi:hypothetical protein